MRSTLKLVTGGKEREREESYTRREVCGWLRSRSVVRVGREVCDGRERYAMGERVCDGREVRVGRVVCDEREVRVRREVRVGREVCDGRERYAMGERSKRVE
jgi:hypothetical protein